jgi:hypothetical protein
MADNFARGGCQCLEVIVHDEDEVGDASAEVAVDVAELKHVAGILVDIVEGAESVLFDPDAPLVDSVLNLDLKTEIKE